MAGVAGRSGRQKEKPLTAELADALFREPPTRAGGKPGKVLDTATAEGNRQLLANADLLMLTGQMRGRDHQNLVKSVNARRGLIIDAEVDRRVAKVLKAAETIKQARTGGRKLRDVGPPGDSFNKPKASDDASA